MRAVTELEKCLIGETQHARGLTPHLTHQTSAQNLYHQHAFQGVQKRSAVGVQERVLRLQHSSEKKETITWKGARNRRVSRETGG